MGNTLSLRETAALLCRKYRLLLLAAVLCAGAAYCLLAFAVGPVYTAQTLLYVNNASSAQAAGNLDLSDLNASQKLVSTYIVILESDAVLEQVARECGLGIPVKDLRRMIFMKPMEETEVLSVSVKSGDPESAAQIANSVAAVAPAELIRVVKAGSVEVISPAKPPLEPSGPHAALGALIGAAVGAALAAAAILAKELLDDTIHHAEDLAARFGFPILGELPAPEKDCPKVWEEALRAIRANLLFALSTGENRCVVLSSTGPEVGKSHVCKGLATAMAQTGATVLLADGDLRRPTQHKLFQLKNTVGLSSVLGGFCSGGEALCPGGPETPDVLTAGPIPPNPSELMGGVRLPGLMTELQKRYAYVFIDCPPLGVVADGLVAAKQAAGLVLVVRCRRTTHQELQKAAAALEFAGVKLLGVVLTDAQR